MEKSRLKFAAATVSSLVADARAAVTLPSDDMAIDEQLMSFEPYKEYRMANVQDCRA
jgi:hypothetical protein